MVISVVQIKDFSLSLVDPERDPPIFGDGEAPCPFAIACELMCLPARDVAELLCVFHLLQESDNVADSLHNGRGQARSIITLNEAFQPPMDYITDLHN